MDAALTEKQDMSAERAQREFVLHWELAAMFGGLCSYMVGKTWNESAGCAQHTFNLHLPPESSSSNPFVCLRPASTCSECEGTRLEQGVV